MAAFKGTTSNVHSATFYEIVEYMIEKEKSENGNKKKIKIKTIAVA